MPVWHEATREARERGDFVLVGITEEQHPDRCRLFAQWQGFEWPILWDPFNLTGSTVVPILLAVDEHGVVRKRLQARRDQAWFLEEFLGTTYPAPAAVPEQEPPTARELLATDGTGIDRAMAALLWGEASEIDASVARLAQRTDEEGAGPVDSFRLGVALRLRYDSPRFRPSDFQDSLDAWSRALGADPNQYIWRRRIQQWGPVLDKPYPFYDWVARAREALVERGETPCAVRVALTGAELAQPSNERPTKSGAEENPAPRRRIERDREGWVAIESAAALHTGSRRVRVTPGTARIHVALRPNASRDVHWTNDAGPALVWVAVPAGWRIRHNLHTLSPPGTETSKEVRRLDFEVVPPAGRAAKPAALKAYALYYVCAGEDGACVYRRQDFDIVVPAPEPVGERGGDGGR